MSEYRLTERITIQNYSEMQDNEGFTVQEWVDYYKCWSGFRTIKGSEFIAAKATNSENTVTFTIRYCKKTKELFNNTRSYRIIYNNKSYDIVYCNDYNNLHNWIDIKATLLN